MRIVNWRRSGRGVWDGVGVTCVGCSVGSGVGIGVGAGVAMGAGCSRSTQPAVLKMVMTARIARMV